MLTVSDSQVDIFFTHIKVFFLMYKNALPIQQLAS